MHNTKFGSHIRWLAAVSGLVGPLSFAGITVGLTVVQYDFMGSLGWNPIWRSDLDWPSGLSLGPLGWLQISNFTFSGAMLVIFAAGLHRGISNGEGSKFGPALLAVAGVAMMLLAFKTDPTLGGDGRTWHGWIHDVAFVLLALSLIAALVALWRRMAGDPRWRSHGRYTLATGIVVAASLALPEAKFYVFLAATLVWFEITAVRLALGSCDSAFRG